MARFCGSPPPCSPKERPDDRPSPSSPPSLSSSAPLSLRASVSPASPSSRLSFPPISDLSYYSSRSPSSSSAFSSSSCASVALLIDEEEMASPFSHAGPASHPESPSRISAILRTLVRHGWLSRKTGMGVQQSEDASEKPQTEETHPAVSSLSPPTSSACGETQAAHTDGREQRRSLLGPATKSNAVPGVSECPSLCLYESPSDGASVSLSPPGEDGAPPVSSRLPACSSSEGRRLRDLCDASVPRESPPAFPFYSTHPSLLVLPCGRLATDEELCFCHTAGYVSRVESVFPSLGSSLPRKAAKAGAAKGRGVPGEKEKKALHASLPDRFKKGRRWSSHNVDTDSKSTSCHSPSAASSADSSLSAQSSASSPSSRASLPRPSSPSVVSVSETPPSPFSRLNAASADSSSNAFDCHLSSHPRSLDGTQPAVFPGSCGGEGNSGHSVSRSEAPCEAETVASSEVHAAPLAEVTRAPGTGFGGAAAAREEEKSEKREAVFPCSSPVSLSVLSTAPSTVASLEESSDARTACDAYAASLEAEPCAATDAKPSAALPPALAVSSSCESHLSSDATDELGNNGPASPALPQFVNLFGGDTFICPRTPHTARLAAGAALELCDLIYGSPTVERHKETRRKRQGLRRKESKGERHAERHRERQQQGGRQERHLEGDEELKAREGETEARLASGVSDEGGRGACSGVCDGRDKQDSEREDDTPAATEEHGGEDRRDDTPAATEEHGGEDRRDDTPAATEEHGGEDRRDGPNEQRQENKVKRGFAIIRPPGHHACSHEAAGFCIYNNVALAANYLLAKHGLSRVAILDWDVHHGNGTQDLFYNSSSVLYLSVHRFEKAKPVSASHGEALHASPSPGAGAAGPSPESPRASDSPAASGAAFYPGTGSLTETGVSVGRGYTINVPLSRGYTDGDMFWVFCGVIAPALTAFRPQAILVSAGFDAAAGDPLGGCLLSPALFAWMTRQVCRLADIHCEGKALFFLEGGYQGDVLGACVEACVAALVNLSEENKPEERHRPKETADNAADAGKGEEKPVKRKESQRGARDRGRDCVDQTVQLCQKERKSRDENEAACSRSLLSGRLGETLARLDSGILQGVEEGVELPSTEGPSACGSPPSISLPASLRVHANPPGWPPFRVLSPSSVSFPSPASPLSSYALPRLLEEPVAAFCPKCRHRVRKRTSLSATSSAGEALSRGASRRASACNSDLSFFVEKRKEPKFVPEPFPPAERWVVIPPSAVDVAMRDAGDVARWAPTATAETPRRKKGRGDRKKKGEKDRSEARKSGSRNANCEERDSHEDVALRLQGIASEVETETGRATPVSVSESCLSPCSNGLLPAFPADSARFGSTLRIPCPTVRSPGALSQGHGLPAVCPQFGSRPSSPSTVLSLSPLCKVWASSPASRPTEVSSACGPLSDEVTSLCSGFRLDAIEEGSQEMTNSQLPQVLGALSASSLAATPGPQCPTSPALVCAACGVPLETAETAFPSSCPASPTLSFSSFSAAASPASFVARPRSGSVSDRVRVGTTQNDGGRQLQKSVVCRQATYDTLRLVRRVHAGSPFFLPPLPPLPKTVKTKSVEAAREQTDGDAETAEQVSLCLRESGDFRDQATDQQSLARAQPSDSAGDGTETRHSTHGVRGSRASAAPEPRPKTPDLSATPSIASPLTSSCSGLSSSGPPHTSTTPCGSTSSFSSSLSVSASLLPASRTLANVLPAGLLSHVRGRIVGGRARGAREESEAALQRNETIEQGQLVKLCNWGEAAFYTWVQMHSKKGEPEETDSGEDVTVTLQALETLFGRLQRPGKNSRENSGELQRKSKDENPTGSETLVVHTTRMPRQEAVTSAVLSFDPQQVLDLLRIQPDGVAISEPPSASSVASDALSPSSVSSDVATELAKFMPRCHRVFWTHAWALAEPPSTRKTNCEGGRKRCHGDEGRGEKEGESRLPRSPTEPRDASVADVDRRSRSALNSSQQSVPQGSSGEASRSSSSSASSSSCLGSSGPESRGAPLAFPASSACGSRFACAVALADLAQFVRPCVMDIKMGIQMYDPSCTDAGKIQRMQEKARGRSVGSHGFFICGVSAGAVDSGTARVSEEISTEAGKSKVLESETTEDLCGGSEACDECNRGAEQDAGQVAASSLRPFVLSSQEAYAVTQDEAFLRVFTNFFCVNDSTELAARLIRKCLGKLATLQRFFERQKQVSFYGSSLLFVFDADPAPDRLPVLRDSSDGPPALSVRRTQYAGTTQTQRPPVLQQNDRRGGGNAERRRDAHRAADVECAECGRKREAVYDAIVESFGVYMVDFAHVNFSRKQHDRGYLFGLANLQRLFARVLHSLGSSPSPAIAEAAVVSEEETRANSSGSGEKKNEAEPKHDREGRP
ncbi:histone deacetylase HDAC1 [Toxoplasma gondii GAB2-2007-GAL-DOM2]|uniref:histone deacetylase n=1 Tax=Toxoplasma gondii GAB2-2007-GAL-DOM2 TaxID=1130820 RepID=A0A086KA13_TOXGO|nr:histone deacetylase HDAC1 [Toxoplasma gondii GAB2-2007-GAL-DOM2]